MKKLTTSACLFTCVAALCGCVTRTYTSKPENRSPITDKSYGSQSSGEKVISTKRVWFWQDEFRNP